MRMENTPRRCYNIPIEQESPSGLTVDKAVRVGSAGGFLFCLSETDTATGISGGDTFGFAVIGNKVRRIGVFDGAASGNVIFAGFRVGEIPGGESVGGKADKQYNHNGNGKRFFAEHNKHLALLN